MRKLYKAALTVNEETGDTISLNVWARDAVQAFKEAETIAKRRFPQATCDCIQEIPMKEESIC